MAALPAAEPSGNRRLREERRASRRARRGTRPGAWLDHRRNRKRRARPGRGHARSRGCGCFVPVFPASGGALGGGKPGMIVATRIPHVPRPSRVSAYFAARLGPAVIDPETVEEVLRRYDLRLAGPSRNLRLGRRSRNVAVTTQRGKKVVKLYRPQWTADTVRY